MKEVSIRLQIFGMAICLQTKACLVSPCETKKIYFQWLDLEESDEVSDMSVSEAVDDAELF